MRCDTYKRIIRICLEEILVNEGTYSNIGDQLIPRMPVAFNDVSHLPSTDLGQEYGMLPQGYPRVTGALLEGMGIPFDQTLPGWASYIHNPFFAHQYMTGFVSTSSSIGYELGQPLHPPAPRSIACTDGQTLPGPSVNHNQEPIATGGKERVRCTWTGCSSVVRKENYTRHMNETHRGKIKGFCTHCGRGFPRPYMKEKHERSCRGPRFE